MPAFADHPIIAFGQESSGPIITMTASTLKAGSWSGGLRTEIIENDTFSDQELLLFATEGNEGVHSTDKLVSTSLSIAYGISDDFTLSVRMPYIERQNIRESEIEDNEPEAHLHGDSSSLGDLLMMGQYRLLETNNTDLALQLGVKTPSGKTDEADKNGERFETEFQPGSGSWDFLAGVAITTVMDRIGYHANLLLNKTTEGAQKTKIGDVLTYNLAVTYRLNKAHKHLNNLSPPHIDVGWDAVLELNGQTRRRNKVFGLEKENSGGTTLFLSPGLRFTAGSVGGFISVGVPVIENTYGNQADIDVRFMAGISFSR